jgi:hypothetical protein
VLKRLAERHPLLVTCAGALLVLVAADLVGSGSGPLWFTFLIGLFLWLMI